MNFKALLNKVLRFYRSAAEKNDDVSFSKTRNEIHSLYEANELTRKKRTLCSKGGSFAWDPDSQNHDYQPYRIMKKGLLLKCDVCRLAYIIPRSSAAFPKQYQKVFSRKEYLKVYPGHPTNWVDPGPGEELETPIKTSIDPSSIWRQKGFDPKLEALTLAYFNAFSDACRNRGLVLGEDSGLFVCTPPELLPEMTKSLIQAHKVHIFTDFQTFVESMRDFSSFASQINSLLLESGAVEQIKRIDRIFKLK